MESTEERLHKAVLSDTQCLLTAQQAKEVFRNLEELKALRERLRMIQLHAQADCL